MDKIINVLLLIIIFVFDPLAISLVIAANYAFEQLKEKYQENIYGEEVEVTPFEMSDYVDEEMEELINEEVEKEKAEIENTPPKPSPLDEILNNPNISDWRKNKIRAEWKPGENIKKYF